MKIVLFYHSLLSDWNHGSAHFLRGVMSELQMRGHEVEVFEPRMGWSLQNLFAERGAEPIIEFQHIYPGLKSTLYDPEHLNLDWALHDADLVIVHEWNEATLIARLGQHRTAQQRYGGYKLLFHDTHHRSITDPASLAASDLSGYDGVLAFGNVVRDLYLQYGWTRQAWTWHEAADTRVFHPHYDSVADGDLVWVGNWGDEERTRELNEFLIEPVRMLKLRARAYGVRYPLQGRQALQSAGIDYKGWLPNYQVPAVFSRHKFTVHIPRRPYVRALPGIPSIRVFEAMACGIPLVCSPWDDVEGLFSPGKDYLIVSTGREMVEHLQALQDDPALGRELADHARQTILGRHTCRHRVDELLTICEQLEVPTRVRTLPPAWVMDGAIS